MFWSLSRRIKYTQRESPFAYPTGSRRYSKMIRFNSPKIETIYLPLNNESAGFPLTNIPLKVQKNNTFEYWKLNEYV